LDPPPASPPPLSGITTQLESELQTG